MNWTEQWLAAAALSPVSLTALDTSHMPGHPPAHMDAQIKRMQGMHEKMMTAKTPEERRALMGEHMKSMRDSMAMLDGPHAGHQPGTAMKPDTDAGPGMPPAMMEKRMDMMQQMMKMMMMERMSASESAQPGGGVKP